MATDVVGGQPLQAPWPQTLLGVRVAWLPGPWSPQVLVWRGRLSLGVVEGSHDSAGGETWRVGLQEPLLGKG